MMLSNPDPGRNTMPTTSGNFTPYPSPDEALGERLIPDEAAVTVRRVFASNTRRAALVKTLYEMNALELPIETIAANLRDQATARFDAEGSGYALPLVMGGWQDSEPFICTVSNFTYRRSAAMPLSRSLHN
jgi:hypothetical protein